MQCVRLVLEVARLLSTAESDDEASSRGLRHTYGKGAQEARPFSRKDPKNGCCAEAQSTQGYGMFVRKKSDVDPKQSL